MRIEEGCFQVPYRSKIQEGLPAPNAILEKERGRTVQEVVRSRSLEENKGIKIQTQNTKQGVDCGLNEEGEQL